MVQVSVKYLLQVREITGEPEESIELEQSSLSELLKRIFEKYNWKLGHRAIDSKTGKKCTYVQTILVNARNYSMLDGLETKLKDGDAIVLY